MRFLIKYFNKIANKFFNIDQKEVPKSLTEVIYSKNKYQTFKDEIGQTFKVISGLRDLLKPHWRTMFQSPSYDILSKKSISQNFNGALKSAQNALKTLAFFGVV